MIVEMTAQALEDDCPTFVALTCGELSKAKALLKNRYFRVEEAEDGFLRVYDAKTPEEIVTYLYENGVTVSEIKTDKIGLEEYYVNLMEKKGAR